jgi:hypothetical protein
LNLTTIEKVLQLWYPDKKLFESFLLMIEHVGDGDMDKEDAAQGLSYYIGKKHGRSKYLFLVYKVSSRLN